MTHASLEGEKSLTKQAIFLVCERKYALSENLFVSITFLAIFSHFRSSYVLIKIPWNSRFLFYNVDLSGGGGGRIAAAQIPFSFFYSLGGYSKLQMSFLWPQRDCCFVYPPLLLFPTGFLGLKFYAYRGSLFNRLLLQAFFLAVFLNRRLSLMSLHFCTGTPKKKCFLPTTFPTFTRD